MDQLVGRTIAKCSDDTLLMVLSDHGFCAFRRGVNLNAWLRREGYLALEADRNESGKYFEGVDWHRTRAYTFGLGGLYINQRGREAEGIVSFAETAALVEELRRKLTGLRDDDTGEMAIPL